MKKVNKKLDVGETKEKSTLVRTNNTITVSEKAVFIYIGDDTYVLPKARVKLLLDGELETKTGSKARAIALSLLTEDGIENQKGFLTVKGKAVYIKPDVDELFIISKTGLKELVDEEKPVLYLKKFSD